ncbi:MAG: hypothetical protein J2P15_07260 [Micromonosporaceae bacterium]|nr:hypothetical protein [Micromonosporaceae bacterium]
MTGGPLPCATLRWSVVALAAVVGLAGCATSAAPASRPTPPPAASTPSAGVAHGLAETVDADHSFVQATVFAYDQPVAAAAVKPSQGDYTWGAADVQTCASRTLVFDVSVSSLPWQVVYPDGKVYPSTRIAQPQFPQPIYSSTIRTLSPGQCVRGWVVFAVPAAGQPDRIRYAPNDSTPVDWYVS